MLIRGPRHSGPGPEEYAVLAALVFLSVLALFLYYTAHPFYFDEAMYAEVPREMLAPGGSFISPTLNFAPFLFKPPLYLWSNAASMALLGHSEVALRLPGVLYSVGSVVFVLLIASRMSRAAGLYAAAALATSFGFVFHNAGMMPDHALVFLVSASVYFFLRVTEGKPYAMKAMYLCLGLAVMTKGLLGLLFPGIAVALFVLTTGRFRLLKKFLDPLGIFCFLAVTVPWHVASEIHNPGFLKSYIINEQVMRFWGKRYPPDLDVLGTPMFLLVNFGWLMPWSAFLLQSLIRPFMRRMTDPERLTLCWALGGTAFFCVSSGKLEYYGMPLFPAYAALAGMYWSRLGEKGGRETGALLGSAFLAVAITAAVVAARFAQGYVAGRSGISLDEAAKFCSLGFRTLLPLAVGSVIGTVLVYRKRYGWAFTALLLASFLMYIPARQGIILIEPENTRDHSAKEMAKVARPDDVLVVDGEYEYEYCSSFPYYTGRKVLILRNNGLPVLAVKFKDKDRFLIEEPEFRALWNSGKRVIFATRRDPARDSIAGLPASSFRALYKDDEDLYTNK